MPFAQRAHDAREHRPTGEVAESTTFAPALLVGHASDPAEHAADAVADRVIARLRQTDEEFSADHHDTEALVGTGPVRRSSGARATPVVGRAGGPVPDDVAGQIGSRIGRGDPLDTGVRGRMETAFGTSLAGVRVHTDDSAATLSGQLSARAFTVGSDIFFGAGQYRPDTAEGEHVLAHELAHTRQQRPAGVGRLHRLWDIDAPQLNWAQTVSVSTVSSGQGVWFLEDGNGEKIAIKAEGNKIGLGELIGQMQGQIVGVKSVRQRKLTGGDRQSIENILMDPAKLDQASFAKLGAGKRSVGWVKSDWEKIRPGTFDAASDFEVGRFFLDKVLHEQHANTPFMAMTMAAGKTAGGESANKKLNPSGGQQDNRMRQLLSDFRHCMALGRMTAVDLFMGNGDRVYMGNIGNWFYDPDSAAMTTIDHVDAGANASMDRTEQTASDMAVLLKALKSDNLGKTAAKCVRSLAAGLSDDKRGGEDQTITQWLDADGGLMRGLIEEGIERGLIEGRKLLIKTFTATRFTIGGKKARAVKKSIKAQARGAQQVDNSNDTADYYSVLKARALWLKKN